MIEKIMKKLGYVKNDVDTMVFELDDKDYMVLFPNSPMYKLVYLIIDATLLEKDLFIDYVKKTDTQKVYMKKGKKKEVVLEI